MGIYRFRLKNLTSRFCVAGDASSPHQNFPGRIDVKLGTIFVSLFLLVFVIGGSSLYLLASHLFKADKIAQQSERLDTAEKISRRFESFASMIQLAQLRGQTVSDAQLWGSLGELRQLLELYEVNGGSPADIQQLRKMIGDSEKIAARIVERQKGSETLGRAELIHDLEAMETVQQRIEKFIEDMAVAHEKVESRLVLATRRKMQVSIGINAGILLMGTVFLIWVTRYCRRAIALPLRQLAARSSEIAKGEFVQSVPIVSRDEIGLLSDAFNHMASQLKAHEERSKGLAILEERERLAAELHDSLAQDLAFLRLKLIEWEKNHATNPAETTRLLDELFPIVDEAYQNLREAIFGLRALALKPQVGLVTALSDFLKDFGDVRDIPVTLRVDRSEAIRFAPEVEIQFVRILHEALTNIVKHAHAKRADITIQCREDKAIISIADDGRGFSKEDCPASSLHFGLQTMQTRAQSVGGKCAVASVLDRGTTVVLELPLAKADYHESHSAFAR